MSDEIYIHQTADDDVEHERLTLMAELYDSATHDLLSSAVDLSGARVLEIGAGHGGIARWLGDQVGPGGRVIATDIDLRFLSSLSHPQVEVRQHNIVTDPLEPNSFDLIHGRFVLGHFFAEAPAVLEKLVTALTSGGCVAFEEGDVGSVLAAEWDHPRAAAWNESSLTPVKVVREAGAIDPEFGRRLPPLFRRSSLVDVTSSASYDISYPGTTYHRFHELSLRSNRRVIDLIPGLKEEWWDIPLESLTDDTFHFGQMTVVRAVGYRR